MGQNIKQVEIQALLTTKEVASYFKVSEATITKKFILRGLKYIKLSARDYRYNMKDVIEFENGLKNEYIPLNNKIDVHCSNVNNKAVKKII